MALVEIFCNASTAFLSHAEDINLWPTIAKLVSLHAGEDGTGTTSGNKLQMNSNDGICREFMEIKTYGLQVRQEFSQSVGLLPENRAKNRYRDILPFDKCRVIFDDTESYVNASLIEGLSSCSSYIAAQGPLPGQACDFWRMIIRYRCPAIVMLCDLVEAGRSKCSQYWPDELGQAKTYGNVTVKLVAEERLATSGAPMQQRNVPDALLFTPTCRTFEVYSVSTDGRPSVHCCRQYQMSGWPDHGVPPPSAITSLIDLAALLIQTYPPSPQHHMDANPQNTLLVHCSAGCGRTGVFIALHQICALLKVHQLDCNIFSTGLLEVVKSLRYQRPAMVQTFDQYVFLYQLVGTLMRRVTRSCLRRLAKMGVSLELGSDSTESTNPIDIATHSPSPPPPKPPDPFRGSNGNLNSAKPNSHHQTVAAGRLMATDLASEMVVAHRSSDWAVLRRAARTLSDTLPQSASPERTKAKNRPAKPATIQRRASTAETPTSLRRSVTSASPVMGNSVHKNGSLRSPLEKPRRPPSFISGTSCSMSFHGDGREMHAGAPKQRSPSPTEFQAMSRLDGMQKQLEQLVNSVEKLVSPPLSPTSPPRPQRPKLSHRRQLSGSYDNISELGIVVDPVFTSNGNDSVFPAESAANGLSGSIHENMTTSSDRIVVDLSNLSPPYQKSSKEASTHKENPMIVSQSMLNPESSPPPPVPPPRRRRRHDQHQHHLSVAHLVLNNHNEAEKGESATLGRCPATSPHSAQSYFSRMSLPTGPLQRQGSLILPSMTASNYQPKNLHFNSIYNHHNGNKQAFFAPDSPAPLKPVLQAPVSLLTKASDDSSLGVSESSGRTPLGRFRSVAHLGQIPNKVSDKKLNSGRASLDNYPISTPTTPSFVREQPTSGRSL